MGVPQTLTIVLHCDNQSAIQLVMNLEFHYKTKHIELQYHFILEQYAAKEADLVYIAYVDQSTDMLLKALIIDKTQHFHKLMGLVSQSYVRFNVEI
jgi:hypothetical protein